jgi:hypothetical protein
MKKLATCLVLFGSLSVSSVALADDGRADDAQRGTITLPGIEITSHYMRPQASISVSRIDTRLTLVELKQLFLQRIEQSVLKGAF